jgi:hypothetical protein
LDDQYGRKEVSVGEYAADVKSKYHSTLLFTFAHEGAVTSAAFTKDMK